MKLNNNAWTVPHLFTQTVTTKELREILLETDGWIMACGYIYDIKHKNLGAGVKRVYLKRREYKD